MNFRSGKDEHEILLVDAENNLLGKGYIYDFRASKLYEKDRINYFIHAVAETNDDYIIKKEIVAELVKRARDGRKNYPDCAARVYHCCLSDQKDCIEFYSSIDGFKHDEGMHILAHDLTKIDSIRDIDYEVKIDCLNTDEEIQLFINEHSKIFTRSYSIDKIREMKGKEGFKNIAIFDSGKMIGNILLFVEDGIGLVEDLFVSKDHRNQGVAAYLVNKGLEYFKSLGLTESRLEVWSSNLRATKLYKKYGYEFLKESESSIGMNI